MSQKTKHLVRLIGRLLFILYLAALVYLLFLADGLGRGVSAGQVYRYNLIPFQEIRRFWIYRNLLGEMAWVNLVGNVVGFVPFGFFMPLVHPHHQSILHTMVTGFFSILTVELTQLVTKTGCFDVDDLMLNLLGVLLGWLAYFTANQIRRKIDGKKKISL